MSAPYTANGEGIVQGGGPQYASVIPGVPLYDHNPVPGVTQPGTIQWLNPNAFVSVVDPSTGACTGGDSVQNCQFGDLGRNALRGPDFFCERSVPDQVVSVDRAREAAHRRGYAEKAHDSPEHRRGEARFPEGEKEGQEERHQQDCAHEEERFHDDLRARTGEVNDRCRSEAVVDVPMNTT